MRDLTAYERKIFAFMGRRAYTRGHLDRLQAVEAIWDETRAEAGPNGAFCELTQKRLREIEAERDEIIQRAVERYEDWASD